MNSYINFFNDLDKSDVAIAGGKGASLGEMKRAGFPVPAGFVITASAFERFLDEADLRPEIEAQLAKVNVEDTNSVEGASVVIRAVIEKASMPKDLEKMFLQHYKKLKTEFVAVRSSATAEDSKTASWAGELESYLITNHKTLLKNIKNCWSSLYTARAIFYRFEKNLHGQPVSVAVVVQKMVHSEISGIVFTVHPVTQDRDQMVIEAAWGLGEAIVGGMITPDSYVVGKPQNPNDKFQIVEVRESEQDFKIEFKPGGGTRKNKLAKHEKGRKLSDEKVLEVAQLAKKVEDHYKMPMDLEFAIEKGKIYLLQARPITTL